MKDYFKNSIVFYYRHLSEQGARDPIKVMIGDFLETVKVTENQKEFLEKQIKSDNLIDNILILIAKMKRDKEYDEDTMELIEKSIMNLKG